jgi:protein involved in polysaccharide export with SLBB domain
VKRFVLGLWMVMGLLVPAAAIARPPLIPDSTEVDWSRAPEYRMVPGDRLLLNFGPNSESSRGFLEREVIIRPDGRISVFPVGDVVAAGHTVRELEAMLVNLLAESYKAPRIVVEVVQVAGNQVHVLGEVMKPGSYPADAFLTVVQAITQAGGFKEGAAKNSVLVFHRNGARDVHVLRLAVDRRIKNGMAEGDVPLSRFDIVYVPRGAVGNMVAFTQSFFGSTASVLSSGLIGWELFNLDRVFRARE